MRPQDIKIGETYRHTGSPDYGYAKVVTILKPYQSPNVLGRVIVECKWAVSKNDDFGLIKYLRPCDLIKEAE